MVTFFLIIHIILAIGIIGLVLFKEVRGGLGIGGSPSGGFMTAHVTANALTKITTFFGAMFLTSIILAILAGGTTGKSSISEELEKSKKKKVYQLQKFQLIIELKFNLCNIANHE